jgi:hypothetical protein
MNLGKLLFVSIGIACAACSDEGSPTEPAGPPLPLTAGLYTLSLAGSAFTCDDLYNPPTGTVVQSLASARAAGHEWIFAPANQSSGDFEIRLAAGGAVTTPGAMAVSGTARGQVLHSFGATPGFPAERASFSTLPVNGELARSDTTVIGRFNGPVLFGRGSFVTVCPPGQVTFVLTRLNE